MILFLIACRVGPTTPNCALYGARSNMECPCTDWGILLDGGSVVVLKCRPDQVLEWGPTPPEDGNVSAACRCQP